MAEQQDLKKIASELGYRYSAVAESGEKAGFLTPLSLSGTVLGAVMPSSLLPPLALAPFVLGAVVPTTAFAYNVYKSHKLVEQLKKQGYTPEQAFKNAVKGVDVSFKYLHELKRELSKHKDELPKSEKSEIRDYINYIRNVGTRYMVLLDEII